MTFFFKICIYFTYTGYVHVSECVYTHMSECPWRPEEAIKWLETPNVHTSGSARDSAWKSKVAS